jgi:hypothetical protein
MSYTVKLVHHLPALSAEERTVAEEAFRDCLEFALGGPDAVLSAWRAFKAAPAGGGSAQAAAAGDGEPDPVARWQTAEADASYFALKPFGPDMGDAYFEISA